MYGMVNEWMNERIYEWMNIKNVKNINRSIKVNGLFFV